MHWNIPCVNIDCGITIGLNVGLSGTSNATSSLSAKCPNVSKIFYFPQLKRTRCISDWFCQMTCYVDVCGLYAYIYVLGKPHKNNANRIKLHIQNIQYGYDADRSVIVYRCQWWPDQNRSQSNIHRWRRQHKLHPKQWLFCDALNVLEVAIV